MTMSLRKIAVAAIALPGLAAIAFAAGLSEGSKALEDASAKMHHTMAVELTGDVDIDFVRSMIPHHQGAVDMANIVLRYSADPELRTLAETIVKTQDSEIAFMNSWLAKKGLSSHGAH